jgi:hypothetical protein
VSWTRPIKSFSDKKEFEMIVRDLEEKGVIEPSKSTWLNPVVLTRKKNASLRFCVDFRRLNDLVEQDHFEIPKISVLLHSLYGMKYFTLIDLKDGFFHVNLRESDREKTAFYTGSRLMQFKKMPQGYKNSPAVFQRCMNLVFEKVIGKKCIVYIDDILVFGQSKSEHDENLAEILNIMNCYELKENRDKRIECVQKIEFLGYEIEFNKIRPSMSRAQGIVDFKRPETKRGLQKFLGMINYDRMFLKNITEETRPLYKLTMKDEKYIWSEKAELAFEKIKNNWKVNLELNIPNYDETFVLETDASDVGLGAVLRQKGLPVAYISRCLTKCERNYRLLRERC